MGHTKRILASTMAMATLAALACAPAANAATPLSLTVNAGDNQNTLKGPAGSPRTGSPTTSTAPT